MAQAASRLSASSLSVEQVANAINGMIAERAEGRLRKIPHGPEESLKPRKAHPKTDGTTFTFLGFCHVWEKSQKGKNVTRRPKYACRKCTDGIVQALAPPRLIEGSLPTEARVADVVVSRLGSSQRVSLAPLKPRRKYDGDLQSMKAGSDSRCCGKARILIDLPAGCADLAYYYF
jgi:hypothetical protein